MPLKSDRLLNKDSEARRYDRNGRKKDFAKKEPRDDRRSMRCGDSREAKRRNEEVLNRKEDTDEGKTEMPEGDVEDKRLSSRCDDSKEVDRPHFQTSHKKDAPSGKDDLIYDDKKAECAEEGPVSEHNNTQVSGENTEEEQESRHQNKHHWEDDDGISKKAGKDGENIRRVAKKDLVTLKAALNSVQTGSVQPNLDGACDHDIVRRSDDVAADVRIVLETGCERRDARDTDMHSNQGRHSNERRKDVSVLGRYSNEKVRGIQGNRKTDTKSKEESSRDGGSELMKQAGRTDRACNSISNPDGNPDVPNPPTKTNGHENNGSADKAGNQSVRRYENTDGQSARRCEKTDGQSARRCKNTDNQSEKRNINTDHQSASRYQNTGNQSERMYNNSSESEKIYKTTQSRGHPRRYYSDRYKSVNSLKETNGKKFIQSETNRSEQKTEEKHEIEGKYEQIEKQIAMDKRTDAPKEQDNVEVHKTDAPKEEIVTAEKVVSHKDKNILGRSSEEDGRRFDRCRRQTDSHLGESSDKKSLVQDVCLKDGGLNSASYGLNPGSYGLNSGSYGLNSGSYGLNSGSYGLNSGSCGLNSGSYGLKSGSYGVNSGSCGLNSGSCGKQNHWRTGARDDGRNRRSQDWRCSQLHGRTRTDTWNKRWQSDEYATTGRCTGLDESNRTGSLYRGGRGAAGGVFCTQSW